MGSRSWSAVAIALTLSAQASAFAQRGGAQGGQAQLGLAIEVDCPDVHAASVAAQIVEIEGSDRYRASSGVLYRVFDHEGDLMVVRERTGSRHVLHRGPLSACGELSVLIAALLALDRASVPVRPPPRRTIRRDPAPTPLTPPWTVSVGVVADLGTLPSSVSVGGSVSVAVGVDALRVVTALGTLPFASAAAAGVHLSAHWVQLRGCVLLGAEWLEQCAGAGTTLFVLNTGSTLQGEPINPSFDLVAATRLSTDLGSELRLTWELALIGAVVAPRFRWEEGSFRTSPVSGRLSIGLAWGPR